MTQSIITPILAGAAEADLEDWGPLEEATGEPMATHGLEVWVDGDSSAGIWQCTPGPSHWTLATNEVIYLVAGRMTVTPDGGEASVVGIGDVAVFPKGWTGTWEIHQTVRKVYSIF
ncbi:MAG: cupin domain-containing protein [Mycobacterium sp.]